MKAIITNPIEINFLKNTSSLTYKEQIELFEINFNKRLTKRQIGNFRKRFNLQPKMETQPYTRFMSLKQIEYFKSIVKGHTTEEIRTLYNNKYNYKLTNKQINDLKIKYGITSGVDTKFKEGVPSHNYKPIGSEFVNDEGYVKIKTKNNKWEYKHRYIWEKEHGKIPKGYSVIFLDQNKNNFDLDNLKLIKRKDKMMACSYGLFSKDKNATEMGILTAQLINKTKEIKNEEKI